MNRTVRRRCRTEAGFTLIEALVAVVVLSFGLISITNLMLVAASSNTVANQGTAAATVASRELERLKSLPFVDPRLAPGGNINADLGVPADRAAVGFRAFDENDPEVHNVAGCYATTIRVDGVGMVQVQWLIEDLVASRGGNPDLPAGVKYIIVRAQGRGSMTGARSRAEFTTIRTENPDPNVVTP